jgi:hypothetical protein
LLISLAAEEYSSPPEKDFQSCNGGVDSQVKKITENICFHEEPTPISLAFSVVVFVNTGSAVSSHGGLL